MSDFLVFLGAGASKTFGVPTMKDFVDELGRDVEKNLSVATPLYNSVVTTLRTIYGRDVDLESVLDVLTDVSSGASTEDFAKRFSPRLARRLATMKTSQTADVTQALKAVDDDVRGNAPMASQLLELARDFIRKVCGGAQRSLAAEVYRAFLTKLTHEAALAVDGRGASVRISEMVRLQNDEAVMAPDVATTNYDLCFEEFCWKFRADYVNGFSPSRSQHEFDFDPNLFDRKEGIHFLKLHGSIDWWKTSLNRVIESRRATPGDGLAGGETISELSIRYPTSDKQLFEYPFLELYSRFGRYLTQAKIWIFIGYRFGDPSIRNLVANLARPDKKVIVVCPGASSIISNDLRIADTAPTYAIEFKFPHNHCIEQISESLRDHPDDLRPRMHLFA